MPTHQAEDDELPAGWATTAGIKAAIAVATAARASAWVLWKLDLGLTLRTGVEELDVGGDAAATAAHDTDFLVGARAPGAGAGWLLGDCQWTGTL